MADMIEIEIEVDENGHFTGQLPAGIAPGKRRIRLQLDNAPTWPKLTPEEIEAALALDDAEFFSQYPNGLGLTAREIANAPEFGAWAHRDDIQDSVEFIAQMRRESRERRAQRRGDD